MKEVRCRDLGMTDDYVARGSTEREVMEDLERHAREAHGIDRFDEEMRRRVREKIRER